MSRPVEALLYGLADCGQAQEAGLSGIHGAVLRISALSEQARGHRLRAGVATEVARALPPLAARFAFVDEGEGLPGGIWGAVTEFGVERPPGAMLHILRVEQEHIDPARVPLDVDALWIRPGHQGSGTSTRFDFRMLEVLSYRHRIILEVPDGAAGVETAIRLARPYALLFGECAWRHPGIVDFEKLEEALSVVARMNRNLP